MISIYKYIESDIDNMKFNKWGWVLKNGKKLKTIKQMLKLGHSYTIFDEKPIAILSFFEYDKDRYYGFIIADECFESNPKYAIKMKYLIGRLVKDFNPKEVVTISEDAPDLNKWHEFLGFKMEERNVKTYRGKPFSKWSIKWE